MTTAIKTYSTPGRTDLFLRRPRPEDGLNMWRLAGKIESLDVNSAYFYTWWAHEFSDNSVVAEDDDGICGFIIGHPRQHDSDRVFIWQAAVDSKHRGRRLAVVMTEFIASNRYRYVDCTVTPSNTASAGFLTAFAASRNAPIEHSPLFGVEHLSEGHEPEILWRIGPLGEPATA